MRFETKRDYSLPLIFLFVALVYTGIAIYTVIRDGDYTIVWTFMGVLILLASFFILIIKTTFFVLEPEQLICHSLFFKRKIPYSTIRKIEKQKGLYAGLKMSTALKGLVIYYNQYDDLLISPEKEEEFIDEIKKRIEIKS